MGLWGPFWGGVYHAAAEEWSAAGEIPTANGAYNTQIIIDTAGRALLSWSNDVTHAWSRTTNGSQWEDAGALGSFANVSVTSTGLATAAWRTTDGFDTQTMDLSDGSPEASGRIGISDGIWGVPLASLDRTAILLWTRSTMSGDVLWLSWKDGSTWLQPEQIASAPQFGQFEFDADEQGNIVVAWREDERLWSRIYERATDSWSEELFVAPTSTNQSITFIDMTNGNALLGFNTGAPDPATWAVMYEAGKGWVESSLVRLHQVNAYVGAALDDAGNGIAISTAEGLGVQVRRYLAGHGWESPPALDVGITGNLWAAAAPDRSVTVVSNTGIGTTRTACAIRFE
jgi:hypothetical protein